MNMHDDYQLPFPSCLPAFYALAIPMSCYISNVFYYLYNNIIHLCVLCRDETFRKAFSELDMIRRTLPPNVKIMALTATATKATRKVVCRKLGMISPVVVFQPPNRHNIINHNLWKKFLLL